MVFEEMSLSNYILQSFNALDPSIAANPSLALSNLTDVRNDPPADGFGGDVHGLTNFSGTLTVGSSVQTSSIQRAASVGIKGKYGVFSASMQLSVSDQQNVSAYTSSFAYTATIYQGTCSFAFPNDFDRIADKVDPTVMQELNGITTPEDAKTFTARYGTHLITSVTAGGTLSIIIQTTAGSYAEASSIAGQVHASFGLIDSVSVAASTAQSFAQSNASSSLVMTVQAYGGNPSLAAEINAGGNSGQVPDTAAWAQSCDDTSVASIAGTVEFWQIADAAPAAVLKAYLNGFLLQSTLNAPIVFTTLVPMVPYKTTLATATVDPGFKVIGGGGAATAGSTCFLAGMYSTPGMLLNPTSWTVEAHDWNKPAASSDALACYALAIYDEDDVIPVRVNVETVAQEAGWVNVGNSASTPPGTFLTGGGVQFSAGDTLAGLMLSSRPFVNDPTWVSDSPNWVSYVYLSPLSDRFADMIISSIGVDLSATDLQTSPMQNEQSSSDIDVGCVSASIKYMIAGGASVSWDNNNINQHHVNLLQQSYPSAPGTWTSGYSNEGEDDSQTISSIAFALNVNGPS